MCVHGSSPLTDGDRKSSVPEPMRFGCRCQIAHLASAWKETGQGVSGEHGGLGPGVVLANVDMLSALSRMVATGHVWPSSNGAQRMWLVC